METFGLNQSPAENQADDNIPEKNNYCKICWQDKGEYKCLGGMICRNCLNKLPYEMRGDIADILIYDAIRAAKKYGGPGAPPKQAVNPQVDKTTESGQAIATPDKEQLSPATTPQAPAPVSQITQPTGENLPLQVSSAKASQPKKHLAIYGIVLGLVLVAAISVLLYINSGKTGGNSLTAEELLAELQNSGFPITQIQTYTENSDPNGLMGVDGEYISLADFSDQRCLNSLSCTVETFANEADAAARYEFLQNSTAQNFFAQTPYNYKNVILRLDSSLSIDTITEYQNALVAILDGKYFTASDSESDYNNNAGNENSNNYDDSYDAEKYSSNGSDVREPLDGFATPTP